MDSLLYVLPRARPGCNPKHAEPGAYTVPEWPVEFVLAQMKVLQLEIGAVG